MALNGCDCYHVFTICCNKTAPSAISPPVSVSQEEEMVSTAVLLGSVGAAGAVLLIIIISLVCCLVRRMRRRREEESDLIEDNNPLYNDIAYYQEGNNYTKDKNAYYK